MLSFERIKWGGVRHSDPRYIALDLEIFARMERIEPTVEDNRILRAILDTASSLPGDSRLGELERALGKVIASNKSERHVLIEILGFAGVLCDPARPSFRSTFVPESDREVTPWHKDDWSYPVKWWTGRNGINQDAIAEWFPHI